MNAGQFRKGLLDYFRRNVNTNFVSKDVDNDDKIILLRNDVEVGSADILLSIGELIASFGNEFDYIKFNDKNPTQVGVPATGKYYMGIYQGWIWIKDSDNNTKQLYSQILQKEVTVSGLSYVDFSPVMLPDNSLVFRFNQLAEGYSISGTRVVFDTAPNQYEIIKVYIPFTFL